MQYHVSVRRWMVILSLGLLTGLAFAAEVDPRPQVLVLGSKNCRPFSIGKAWPALVQTQHPEWVIHVEAEPIQTPAGQKPRDARIADVAAGLPALLSRYTRIDMVLVVMGTEDAADAEYQKRDAAALRQDLEAILETLKANPVTSKARVVLGTPFPVIQKRLDTWQAKVFTQGEVNCDAIAESVRALAKDRQIPLIDIHKMVKEKADDQGQPGLLMGTIGWMMRDWGHPIFARMIEPELVTLMPPPPDPAAFEAWKQQEALFTELDQILRETGEGTVNHGEPLQVAPTQGVDPQKKTWTLAIPATALAGKHLNLLIQAGKGESLASPGGAEGNKPVLKVKTKTGETQIPMPATEWQVLDSASPDKSVDPQRFAANIAKMRFYMAAASRDNRDLWLLIRFPLATIHGQEVQEAMVQISSAPPSIADKGTDPVADLKAEGTLLAFPITGRDADWDPELATWRTRDGRRPWTGGRPDVEKRKGALTEFLKKNLPKPVEDLAKDELKRL